MTLQVKKFVPVPSPTYDVLGLDRGRLDLIITALQCYPRDSLWKGDAKALAEELTALKLGTG